ncbi:MAG: hypothetical protein RSA40_01245 [Malacoplasma sp.]
MNKLNDNGISVDPLKKHVVLNIDRILNTNKEMVLEYEKFLANFVNEAIKDNCNIYFLIQVKKPNLDSELKTEDNNLPFSFKRLDEQSSEVDMTLIKRIQEILASIELPENNNECFYFLKDEVETFESFVKRDSFVEMFNYRNTMFIFDNPKSAEHLFFNNFFTVFLSSLSINIDNWDYRSAKKICQCLIDDNISNWGYDRVNYEFISFLELTTN